MYILYFTSSHQTFELLDQENMLLNDAIMERTLLEQIVSAFESLFPRNAVDVRAALYFVERGSSNIFNYLLVVYTVEFRYSQYYQRDSYCIYTGCRDCSPQLSH
jgi:hypothetical protein